MMSYNVSTIQRIQKISSLLAYVNLALAVLVGSGWYLKLSLLTRIHPDFPAMQPNTALGIILSAICILSFRKAGKVSSLIFPAASSLIFLLGFLTLIQYGFNISFGIDEFFTNVPKTSPQPFPGRPSPQTAINFSLLGFGFLLIRNHRISALFGQIFFLGSAANAIVASTGYIFSTNNFYGFPFSLPHIGMGILTTFAFMTLSVCAIFLRPREGIVEILISNTRSGKILRKSLTTLILAPPLIGSILRLGVNLELYDVDDHYALFSLALMALFAAIIWSTGERSYQEEIISRDYDRKLKLSEKKFRTLLEYAQDAIFSIDKNGKVNFINRQLSKWFQYSEDEILGRPAEILLPERFHGDLALRDQFLANPEPKPTGFGSKLYGRRKDGTEFPIEVALSPAETPEGLIVMAIIRDVTLQKRRESQLRFLTEIGNILSESLEYKENLEKTAQYLVPEIADGCIVHLLSESGLRVIATVHRNPLSEKLAQDVAVDISRCTRSTDLKKVLSANEAVVVSDSTKLKTDPRNEDDALLPILREKGITSYSLIPLIGHGKTLGILSLYMDVSGRKMGYEDKEFQVSLGKRMSLSFENSLLLLQTRQAMSAREDILSNISELKTPLSSVLLNAQLMLDRAPLMKEGDFIRKIAVGIQGLSEQMLRMISDLAEITSIETGNLNLNLRNYDNLRLMKDLEKKFSSRLKNLEINFEINSPAERFVLKCDPEKLGKAYSIIMDRALEQTPKNGAIHVSCRKSEDQIILEFFNAGADLSSEEEEHFFNRNYFGGTSSAKERSMRLFIAKGIIEAHGGDVEVSSERGKGTTVSFRLPLAYPDVPGQELDRFYQNEDLDLRH